MRLTKTLLVVSAFAALSAVALTGCSSGSTAGSSGGGSLTIAKPDGAAILSTQTNNPFISTGSGMSLGYDRMIYEPLAMVNPRRQERDDPRGSLPRSSGTPTTPS